MGDLFSVDENGASETDWDGDIAQDVFAAGTDDFLVVVVLKGETRDGGLGELVLGDQPFAAEEDSALEVTDGVFELVLLDFTVLEFFKDGFVGKLVERGSRLFVAFFAGLDAWANSFSQDVGDGLVKLFSLERAAAERFDNLAVSTLQCFAEKLLLLSREEGVGAGGFPGGLTLSGGSSR